jgi:hypothetical protein
MIFKIKSYVLGSSHYSPGDESVVIKIGQFLEFCLVFILSVVHVILDYILNFRSNIT